MESRAVEKKGGTGNENHGDEKENTGNKISRHTNKYN
jgi:hypothetical protein